MIKQLLFLNSIPSPGDVCQHNFLRVPERSHVLKTEEFCNPRGLKTSPELNRFAGSFNEKENHKHNNINKLPCRRRRLFS